MKDFLIQNYDKIIGGVVGLFGIIWLWFKALQKTKSGLKIIKIDRDEESEKIRGSNSNKPENRGYPVVGFNETHKKKYDEEINQIIKSNPKIRKLYIKEKELKLIEKILNPFKIFYS